MSDKKEFKEKLSVRPGRRISTDTPDVPPWEPIADWLARLPDVSCDEEHQDTRLPQNADKKTVRKRYEKTAKAIAYDIAVSGVDDE